jgi:hypothetical protein
VEPIVAIDEFAKRVLLGPFLLENSIHGAHETGAIGTMVAVNQKRPVF